MLVLSFWSQYLPTCWSHFILKHYSQPAGVGFSYNLNESTNPIATLAKGGADFYKFVKLFFGSAFPSYASNGLHITGESYAGHYVPNYVRYGLEHSDPLNISSIFVGNAYIDSFETIASMYDMFCDAELDLGPGGAEYNVTLPILPEDECASLAHNISVCLEAASACKLMQPGSEASKIVCHAVSKWCDVSAGREMRVFREGLNPFDIRRRCVGGTSTCYEASNWIEAHLNTPEALAALGVPAGRNFSTDADELAIQWDKSGENTRLTTPDVAALLEMRLDVLFYNGDVDAAVPSPGQRRLFDAMEWSHQIEYRSERYRKWKGGLYKGVENLWYAQIAGSGHMVPTDQPEIASYLVEKWIFGDRSKFGAQIATE